MGTFQGGTFRAIQEYFQQQNCRSCHQPFTPDGIQLLRQELGMLVVRVGCSACGRPLGVAIVGTRVLPGKSPEKHPPEWTKRDLDRFADKPAITYDDVLAAHEFLADVGSKWSAHLPKYGRAAS